MTTYPEDNEDCSPGITGFCYTHGQDYLECISEVGEEEE